jgi:hypothetical protein
MKSTAIALVLLSIASHGRAEVISAMGSGVTTCATFSELVSKDQHADFFYFSWAQGYMSATNGVNQLAGRYIADLSAISTEGQLARIRSYCAEHPLEEYAYAVKNLYLPLVNPTTAQR